MLSLRFIPCRWYQTLFGHVPEHFKWSCHIRQNISGYGVNQANILFAIALTEIHFTSPFLITYSRYENYLLLDISHNFANYLPRFIEHRYRANASEERVVSFVNDEKFKKTLPNN